MQDLINNIDLKGENNAIIFPIPIIPDPTIRISRREIFRLSEKELPYGVNKIEKEVTISSDTENAHKKAIYYELAHGFIEAEDLCKKYLFRLFDFYISLFGLLKEKQFSFV